MRRSIRKRKKEEKVERRIKTISDVFVELDNFLDMEKNPPPGIGGGPKKFSLMDMLMVKEKHPSEKKKDEIEKFEEYLNRFGYSRVREDGEIVSFDYDPEKYFEARKRYYEKKRRLKKIEEEEQKSPPDTTRSTASSVESTLRHTKKTKLNRTLKRLEKEKTRLSFVNCAPAFILRKSFYVHFLQYYVIRKIPRFSITEENVHSLCDALMNFAEIYKNKEEFRGILPDREVTQIIQIIKVAKEHIPRCFEAETELARKVESELLYEEEKLAEQRHLKNMKILQDSAGKGKQGSGKKKSKKKVKIPKGVKVFNPPNHTLMTFTGPDQDDHPYLGGAQYWKVTKNGLIEQSILEVTYTQSAENISFTERILLHRKKKQKKEEVEGEGEGEEEEEEEDKKNKKNKKDKNVNIVELLRPHDKIFMNVRVPRIQGFADIRAVGHVHPDLEFLASEEFEKKD